MAGIDTILNETDHGLINLYNFITNTVYHDMFHENKDQCYWHPDYKHPEYSAAYKYTDNWSLKPRSLYNSTTQFILNEIMRRWENAESLYREAWWEAHGNFCTRLSIIKPEVKEETQEETRKHVVETIIYNNETFTRIGSGLKRIAYLSPDQTYVIKIPHNSIGFDENKEEARIYESNPGGIYAECELLSDGNLKMEYVKPEYFINTEKEDIPDWVYTIAEAQVGHNLSGKLVAYDYGSKI